MKLYLSSIADLEGPARVAFDDLLAQMPSQWDVSHTANGRLKRRLLLAYHSTTQSLSNATWTAVEFNSEEDFRAETRIIAPGTGFHVKTFRPDRFYITPDMTGPVRVRARVSFAADVDGDRGLRLMRNDAVFRYGTMVKSPTATNVGVVESEWTFIATAGESYVVQAYHSAGASLSIGSASRDSANEVQWECL